VEAGAETALVPFAAGAGAVFFLGPNLRSKYTDLGWGPVYLPRGKGTSPLLGCLRGLRWGILGVAKGYLGEPMKRAIFLDRDGTINKQIVGSYVSRWEDFCWMPGAIAAIRAINRAGYLALLVTNQGGIAHGFCTEADVDILHATMQRDLANNDAHLDAIYVCPHHPTGKVAPYNTVCTCRKPAPGMLESAIDMFDIDVHNSYMIGDMESDVSAAQAAGVSGILLRPEDNLETVVNFLLENKSVLA
jgi:D-glycero-D-manno-heptose 1,7-bisphosphate phosphatase